MEAVGIRRRFCANLMDRRWLAPGIMELRLVRPRMFHFIPGQFVRFAMTGYWRDYTMVSRPGGESLDFCIAVAEGGRFSGDVENLARGFPFQVSGPHGHFVFQGPLNPAVFVATGTGLAPFVAFCRSGVSDALLLHGVRTPDQLIYRDLLQAVCRAYVPCLSRPLERRAGLDRVFPGRVTGYLEQRLKPGTYDFYLCGRREMIRDVTALIDERFGDSRLFVEPFD